MATITNERLAKHRQALSSKLSTVTWTKAQVNAAVQAVVDLLQSPSSRSAVSSEIETAAPGVFNATEKQEIFVRAVDELFEQEK